jgi:phage tail-like protein
MGTYATTKDNPLVGARFGVVFSLNQFVDTGFSRISGAEASADTIEYREGGQNFTPRKFPGLARFAATMFERGATTNLDMYQWAATAWALNPNAVPYEDGYNPATSFRRDISVLALGPDLQTTVRTWVLHAAWPSSVRMSDFDAQSSTALIESMTIQHEGFDYYVGESGS